MHDNNPSGTGGTLRKSAGSKRRLELGRLTTAAATGEEYGYDDRGITGTYFKFRSLSRSCSDQFRHPSGPRDSGNRKRLGSQDTDAPSCRGSRRFVKIFHFDCRYPRNAVPILLEVSAASCRRREAVIDRHPSSATTEPRPTPPRTLREHPLPGRLRPRSPVVMKLCIKCIG